MGSVKQRVLVWGGILVSLVCLYIVFRSVPVADLVRELRRIHWFAIIPAIFFLYLGIYWRGWRWRWLFGGGEHRGKEWVCLEGVFVGYGFNNILPSGRMGEFARALYVSRKTGERLGFVLGTVVNDRVFDSCAILLLVGMTAAVVFPLPPDLQVGFGGFELSSEILNPLFLNLSIGSLMVVVFVLLLLIPGTAKLILSAIDRLPFLPGRVRESLSQFVAAGFRGLHGVKDLRRLFYVLSFTALIWGSQAAAAYALAWAVPGLSMSWAQAVGLMALASVCAAIPAAPGFWGLYEAGIMFSFQLLEIHDDPALALAYGVTMHLIYYVPTTLVGLIFAFRSALSLRSASELASREQPGD